ncbi:hypothetical protein KFZ56_01535 [Virgibacillus sp. NKC19-3]|uniref:Mom family adenine methylcarbamoylation protein n=1 Tax=Virgibacillus saliphilus TaxID=2831674 RepID=UPI001C9B6D36|nr:hypothetical protein [Virgibacillus sp. NKC19-3]MBY7141796.1 hypothetical protein [Virgibacillus sp. NKC19-3]
MVKTPLIIKEVPKEKAIHFIRKYHYSKIIPKLCKYFLGIFSESERRLLGVVELGWGTQPLQTIRKLFPDFNLKTNDYLEIGKMCFLPEMNHNNYFGSRTLSTLIKWLKEETDCLYLYTLADGIEGKCGYVYQASNFFYCGYFKTSVYRDNRTYEKIHPRSARALLEENALFENVSKKHWLTQDFCEYKGIEKINGRMFRYIYPLTKEAKRLLKFYPYNRRNYPKDKDLVFEKRIAHRKYERISQPSFDKHASFYNVQNVD